MPTNETPPPSDDTAPPSDAVPPYIDPTRPSIARVYDAALNGKDNYEVDRELLRVIQQVMPETLEYAWDNRSFLIRA